MEHYRSSECVIDHFDVGRTEYLILLWILRVKTLTFHSQLRTERFPLSINEMIVSEMRLSIRSSCLFSSESMRVIDISTYVTISFLSIWRIDGSSLFFYLLGIWFVSSSRGETRRKMSIVEIDGLIWSTFFLFLMRKTIKRYRSIGEISQWERRKWCSHQSDPTLRQSTYLSHSLGDHQISVKLVTCRKRNRSKRSLRSSTGQYNAQKLKKKQKNRHSQQAWRERENERNTQV